MHDGALKIQPSQDIGSLKNPALPPRKVCISFLRDNSRPSNPISRIDTCATVTIYIAVEIG